jgi:hypothetical protein
VQLWKAPHPEEPRSGEKGGTEDNLLVEAIVVSALAARSARNSLFQPRKPVQHHRHWQLEGLGIFCDLEWLGFCGVAQATVTVRQTAKDRDRKSR